ncbi:CalY family protein [Herbiconiux sp. L3-i23]|uniref:CalY family protein n=1 Tax=Herbiconiux sp. L3-i23 TaxID=2905871 RepID=UPI00205A7DA9|nr:CalY family protein [Herbiconiux sp. L3-i23]BDI23888.1 hypothetical protein L3i23_26640 [Herbiconiux sp. L3-i23]
MTSITTAQQPSKRKRAIVVGLAAAVLTAGLAGAAFQSTGAWFTDSKTSNLNTVTAGTLSLGNLGDGTNGLIQSTNSYPMTDAQATALVSDAPETVIKVRNTGSLPLKATVALTNATIAKSTTNIATGTPSKSLVKVSTYNAASNTWGTPVTLDAFVSSSTTQFANLEVAPNATREIKLRVFFGENAGNEYQGATVGFDAKAEAIQVNR